MLSSPQCFDDIITSTVLSRLLQSWPSVSENLPLFVVVIHGFFHLDLSILFLLLVVMGVMHEADDAYSIQSIWSCLLAGPISHASIQHMDFVEVFNVSLDLSTIYFARFSGC